MAVINKYINLTNAETKRYFPEGVGLGMKPRSRKNLFLLETEK